MTIPIQMILHGFIAAASQINFTSKGAARFHARVGVEHYRKVTDGSFTKLEPTFHDLVAYAKTAERAYANFKVGDNSVASDYINEYEIDRNGQTQAREEFVTCRIRHDLTRTKYEVDRTPSRQPDPPGADLPTAKEPAQVVAL